MRGRIRQLKKEWMIRHPDQFNQTKAILLICFALFFYLKNNLL